MTQQKITPCLWFDKEAVESAEFYIKIFPNSKITCKSILKDTPSGDCDIVNFQIMGFDLMSFNAGTKFKINPSISFIVGCEKKEDVDELWNRLSEGGKALMPLDKYPFSDRYGWIQDKYGVSWQLILTKPEGDERPKIIPSLLFVKKKSGKAKIARDYYLSVFKNSKKGATAYFEDDTQFNQKKGDVMFLDFKLEDIWIAAMDGGDPHEFDFNEAISFMVNCKDQHEIDYYWNTLTTDGGEESLCGWLKDTFGLSWQVQPENILELLSRNPKKTTPAMLKMKKIIIGDLKKAGD